MAGLFEEAGKLLLFRFDPETAHRMAIRGLAMGVHQASPAPDPRLRRSLLGLDFAGPVGLAAGFDKSGEAVDGLLRLGFGFVEIGSVTPRPQAGNPKPRLFRLPADRAIINRFGFNNAGADAVRDRLAARRDRPGIVGVNLGANKDSADRGADYVRGVEVFAGLASYLAINVSSPNTPGLRDLQEAQALGGLLRRVLDARDRVTAGGRKTPVLVKLAPDIDAVALVAIVEAAVGAGIDGLIIANTTLARDGLRPATAAAEAGGLSGPPLFRRSTALLARVRRQVGPGMPLIGVGGIETGADAFTKLAAGADLVQIYTGMIYGGHRLAAAIHHDLATRLGAIGKGSIADIVGTETDRWANETV